MHFIDAEETICPDCGYNTLSVQHSPYLPKGTLLMGRYTAGKVISISADKATYMGFDSERQCAVKIHEFLPQSLIIREPDETAVTVRVKHEKLYYDCMNSFEALWSRLSGIDAPAFDKVYDVFFSNNTVYSVCEYTDAITLKEYFDSREKLLSWQKACAAFRPVMNVLSQLHSMNIVHGDLSPVSVLVGADGKLRISSLNIPEAHGIYEEICQQPFMGYAPVERCKDQSLLSPATDIYSLTALMYTAVTGFVPPPSTARLGGDTLMFPASVESTMSAEALEAFFSAMEIYPSKRTDSIEKLMLSFFSSAHAPEAVQTQENDQNEKGRKVNKEEKAVKNEKEKAKAESSSTSVIFLKSFVTAVVVIVLVFVTMYATVLYDYMEIPALDNALSAFSFLPLNIDNEEAEETTVPAITQESTTVAEDVVVADFTSLRYQDIKQNAVFRKNFDIVYEFEYSDDFEENAVISQSIPFGETVKAGTTVTLVISKGVEPVILKDVIGMDYADAKAVLEDDGFVVKKKKLKNDGLQTPDQVFIMSLVAGLEFEKGTEVTLSVWGKVKTEESGETTKKDNAEEKTTKASSED